MKCKHLWPSGAKRIVFKCHFCKRNVCNVCSTIVDTDPLGKAFGMSSLSNIEVCPYCLGTRINEEVLEAQK